MFVFKLASKGGFALLQESPRKARVLGGCFVSAAGQEKYLIPVSESSQDPVEVYDHR